MLPFPGLAVAMASGTFAVYFVYAALRWATLRSSSFDLAYFDQVVWNASQGHGFASSFAPYPFFGQHFSPALALFVPLYAIHPSPVWLLAAQSIALGAAILPLFALARTWLDVPSAAIACAAFALQLFVLRAVNYDFHTEVLAVPFVFWAVLGGARASRAGDLTLVLAGCMPMLCKEDGALVSLGVGFLGWAVFHRRAGILLMAVGVIYGLLVTVVVMPAIRNGVPQDLIARYGYLGSSVPGILLGVVTHPDLAIKHLLNPGPLSAVVLLLGGVAFLPLMRPIALAAAAPALLFALLSQRYQQQMLFDQYGIQSGPMVFIAALLGWARVRTLTPRFEFVRPALAGSTVLALALGAPSIGLGSLQAGRDAQSLAAAVPALASVDASDDLLPMLSERRSMGILGAPHREWVAVDASTPNGDLLAALPVHGYVMVGRWGRLSLWHEER